ncbi:MAG: gliding motility-associated C-terminal domain-containing protein, partial [Flavobacteriales bacterium]
FSPNGDGKNDLFYAYKEFSTNQLPFLLDYHLTVFDRWGVEVFSSADATIGWNGRVDNTKNDLSDGVYYWTMTAFNPCTEKTEEIHGFVHLMR